MRGQTTYKSFDPLNPYISKLKSFLKRESGRRYIVTEIYTFYSKIFDSKPSEIGISNVTNLIKNSRFRRVESFRLLNEKFRNSVEYDRV